MRPHLAAGLLLLLATVVGVVAKEPEGDNAPPALPPLTKPTSTQDCLETMDLVVKQAEDADLLEDQQEEVESLLEKMDDACHDRKFDEALVAGQAVHKILATNK